MIPTNRLNPAIQKAIGYTPVPNVGVAQGLKSFPSYNTTTSPKLCNDWDQYNVRIDHRFTDRDSVYGSFSNADESQLTPGRRVLGGMMAPMTDRLYTFTCNRTFTPNLINEFRFGYNDSTSYQLSEGANKGINYAKDVFGMKNTSDNPFDFGLPFLDIAGFNSVGSSPEAIGAHDQNIQFVDNLSWVHGRHNLQAGIQAIRQIYYQITDFNGNPVVTFDGRYTGTVGNGLADYLLGIPYSASAAVGDSSQDERSTFWGGYLQDSWRVTPNFTLNIGLRYEYQSPTTEIRGRSGYFNPELGRMITAGNGVRQSIVDPDFNNFAPRVGFSYNPSFLKNTVIRAGAGTYYSTDQTNYDQWKIIGTPYYQPQTIYSDPTRPTLSFSDLMPPLTASTNLNPFTYDRRNRTPYVNQWTMDIQHSFAHDMVFEVGYAGSTSQKLMQARNLNVPTIDPTGTIPIKNRVPYPNYGFILAQYAGGWASYQSMTARLEKRFSGGLSFLAAYTFSKSLDLGTFAAVSSDFKNWDKDHTYNDTPHRFVFSYTYELPIGRGKHLLKSAPAAVDAVLGGWQVNGIVTFQSGTYYGVTMATDWLNLGSYATSRPNIVGDYAANRSYPYHYLDAAAFDYPRDASGNKIHVEGNAGRASIQMPGLRNWDMGLSKHFRIKERFDTQFRAEAFNFLNHAQWGYPDLVWGSPTFGQISSTLVSARRLQLGLKAMF